MAKALVGPWAMIAIIVGVGLVGFVYGNSLIHNSWIWIPGLLAYLGLATLETVSTDARL